MVLATNVKTGRTQAEPVTAVLVHHDTNRYDLRVKTMHGTAVIHTTTTHLFGDPASRKWVGAGALRHGAHLQASRGAAATVLGGHAPKTSSGWMWDLTVAGDHDFYVVARSAPVLAHNCGPSPLRLLHPRSSLSQSSLEYWGQRSTSDIVGSLRPGSEEPLLVKPNGLIMNGNTRITILMERGYEVNALPRVPYADEPPDDLFPEGG